MLMLRKKPLEPTDGKVSTAVLMLPLKDILKGLLEESEQGSEAADGQYMCLLSCRHTLNFTKFFIPPRYRCCGQNHGMLHILRVVQWELLVGSTHKLHPTSYTQLQKAINYISGMKISPRIKDCW